MLVQNNMTASVGVTPEAVGASDPTRSSINIDVSVIVNATAGKGCTDAWADDLTQQFAQHGLAAHITLAKNGAEIHAGTKAAITGGATVVIAGGGDGTINAVASQLAGTDIVLGVLPLGTLNHFAKDLGIPLQLQAAVAVIASGRRAQIDVAEVNGKLFVNNSSIGLYPQIVRHREQQQRLGRSKWNAFFWALLSAARRFPFYQITVCIDGQEHRRTTPFVFIGNNRYTMEGFHIGQRDRLDAGVLSFYSARGIGRFGMFGLALSALLGRLHQASNFESELTTELTIETKRHSLRVSTDGEVNVMNAPLNYRILPGALRVIVPSENPSETTA